MILKGRGKKSNTSSCAVYVIFKLFSEKSWKFGEEGEGCVSVISSWPDVKHWGWIVAAQGREFRDAADPCAFEDF